MSSRAPLGVVVLAVALAGCADWERGPAPVVPDASETSDAGASETAAGETGRLSYASDIAPLTARCATCHATGQEAGRTQLLLTGNPAADYGTVKKFVDTSAPSGSRLLSKMSGKGHEGGTIYAAGSPEYQTFLQWIQQGASP
jgi:hypothetical protein